jgi:thioredoxin-like negative regulator of GroEL
MRKNSSLFYQDKRNWEKPLRIWSKSKLAECYKQTKQMAKAQELLVELSKENTAGMPIYAMTQLAGAVQQQLPNRPLESMIKKAEPENKTSVEYWLGRAKYYQGRKEDASVIEAYKKALALSQLGAKPNASVQANRLRALNDYIRYLGATNRASQGNALWWQEYDSSSDFNYHKSIINSIWSCDASLLKADNPRLWSYLAQSQNWDYLEEHLLRSMIQSPSFDAKIFWLKAEKLLTPQYPTRAKTLGWVMTRSSQSKRAIPLLESACLTLKDKDALRSCRFTLFEAYLDAGQWRQAEKIWTEARRQLTPGEVPNWLSKIALLAAKQGDKKDALRLWQAKDQIDPSDLAPIQELASYGLKPELIDYYRKMDKESPSSQIPKKALKILR